MTRKFICQTVNERGSICVVHLTSDDDPALQPTEILMNTPSDQYHQYRAGDVWLVEMTLLSRRTNLN
jgi:hypothetical protein